jgi:hypothetical protein
MKKNTSGQIIGAQIIDASDGSNFSGSVTVYVTIDGGTQAIGTVGSGVCTNEGNGFYSYAPSQAETNGNHIAFTFVGTGAVGATVQVYTTFPQSGDAYATATNIETDTQDIQSRLPAALVSGRMDASVGAMAANTLTASALASDAVAEIQSGMATSAALQTVDDELGALVTDIGANGAGLTALPWNAAWDAEVQSEVTDALNAYDPPTNAEMEARTLVAADYATATALATVDGVVDAIKVTTDKLDTTVVLDGAVYQFTANALELAPSGGGGLTAADIWSYTTHELTSGANIVLAKDVGVTGFNDLSAAEVNAEVDTALSDVGLTTTVTGRIDAAISTRATPADVPSAADNAEAVLLADWETISGTPPDYCLLYAAFALRCAFSTEATPGQYIVYDPSGSVAWQRTLTTDPAAEPIVSTVGA